MPSLLSPALLPSALPPPALPPRALRRQAARVLLAGLALLLAGQSIAEQRRRTAGQARLLAWVSAPAETAAAVESTTGAPVEPELAREIAREGDLERAKLVAAGAVLAREIDPQRLAGLASREARAEAVASARRLDGAAALASEALAARPAAWDAALILGGATYFARSRVEDDRLIRAWREWEGPLTVARALGNGRREPSLLLGAAYVETWWALSPRKRESVRSLVAAALADLEMFPGLIGPWLEVAPSREAGLALVPDDPGAWERLEGLFAERADWDGYLLARTRRRQALQRRLASDLAEAEEQLGGGDPAGARSLFLRVAARAEPGGQGAALLERALAQAPPGPADGATAGQLASQLDWVLDRCLTSGCSLSPPALRRLARFCRDLAPPQEALSALLAGDLDQAEIVERREAAQWSAEWAPYLVAKARFLAGRGRQAEAAAVLALVHRDWQTRPSYWLVRAEVARAAADAMAEAEAAAELARLGSFSQPATAWTFRRGHARLELLLPAPAAGLRLAVDRAPERGAAVELRLDGAPLGAGAAHAGGTLAWTVPVEAGLHVLELASLAGGTVAPGDVRWIPAGGARGG